MSRFAEKARSVCSARTGGVLKALDDDVFHHPDVLHSNGLLSDGRELPTSVTIVPSTGPARGRGRRAEVFWSRSFRTRDARQTVSWLPSWRWPATISRTMIKAYWPVPDMLLTAGSAVPMPPHPPPTRSGCRTGRRSLRGKLAAGACLVLKPQAPEQRNRRGDPAGARVLSQCCSSQTNLDDGATAAILEEDRRSLRGRGGCPGQLQRGCSPRPALYAIFPGRSSRRKRCQE